MKALILNNEVVDIAEQTFEVHEDLYWVDCPDEVKKDWKYVGGQFVEPEIIVNRQITKEELQAQLLLLQEQLNSMN